MQIYCKKIKGWQYEIFNTEPTFPFLKVKQIHSNKVINTQLNCSEEADGIAVPAHYKIPLAITTADCLPIFILGTKGVVALHAGWRGLATFILQHPLVKNINPQYCFIGPHIKACCFEVKLDFISHFPLSIKFLTQQGKKYHFNLTQEAQRQLGSFYPDCQIEEANICTYCDKKFYSFRRDKTNQRNWNIFSQV